MRDSAKALSLNDKIIGAYLTLTVLQDKSEIELFLGRQTSVPGLRSLCAHIIFQFLFHFSGVRYSHVTCIELAYIFKR